MTTSQIAATSSTSELDALPAFDFPKSRRGTPTWEMAFDYPYQGDWTEEQYLSLDIGRLVEFTDGVLEFLPMPKMSHARISKFVSELLNAYVTSNSLGEVLWAPCPIRVAPTKLRAPDVLYLSKQRIPEADTPPQGADLVVEIVSEGPQCRQHDYETKRAEYAAAGIPEYWIVDPETETITVLTLVGESYKVHDEFRSGSTATSVLLPGFEVDVSAAFAAARPQK